MIPRVLKIMSGDNKITPGMAYNKFVKFWLVNYSEIHLEIKWLRKNFMNRCYRLQRGLSKGLSTILLESDIFWAMKEVL